jgi:hypothetical protein
VIRIRRPVALEARTPFSALYRAVVIAAIRSWLK